MLYITTRNSSNTFQAQQTLIDSYALDGALYIPENFPDYDEKSLLLLRENSFGTNIANILNQFFDSDLSGWDVDFCIGRNVFRLVTMSHRIVIGELWHSLTDKYSYIVQQLYEKLAAINKISAIPTRWFRTACEIAILFALYGEMLKCEYTHIHQKFDISIDEGDFAQVMAAYYARKMGLPIDMIVCACDENSPVWELVHRGSFNTAQANAKLRLGVEQLIYESLGQAEAERYINCCSRNQVYALSEELFEITNFKLFCAVPGPSRAAAVINSIYRNTAYLLDPITALCYGSMQDYRAKSGSGNAMLLIAREIPTHFINEITTAAGISATKLAQQVE